MGAIKSSRILNQGNQNDCVWYSLWRCLETWTGKQYDNGLELVKNLTNKYSPDDSDGTITNFLEGMIKEGIDDFKLQGRRANLTPNEIKSYLDKDMPVIVSIEDFFYVKWHVSVYEGYKTEGWWVANSWGTGWGKNGYATMPYSTKILNAWVGIPFGAENPPQVITEPSRPILMWPVKSNFPISQGFGLTDFAKANPSIYKYSGGIHTGVDIDCPIGAPIYNSCNIDGLAEVIFAAPAGGWGNLVWIRGEQGMEIWYAHLDKIMVKPNDKLKRGQLIGYSGKTGTATGPHLHWEIRTSPGQWTNPFDFPISALP